MPAGKATTIGLKRSGFELSNGAGIGTPIVGQGIQLNRSTTTTTPVVVVMDELGQLLLLATTVRHEIPNHFGNPQIASGAGRDGAIVFAKVGPVP